LLLLFSKLIGNGGAPGLFPKLLNAQGGEAQNIRGSAVCCLRTKQHDSRGYLGGQEPKYQSIVEAISVKLEMWKYEDELSPRFAGNDG